MINKNIHKLYFVGIKGVGMTMLAGFLAQLGYIISGSDTKETFMTDQVLKKHGIKVHQGFSVNNLKDDFDLVVYSSAYNKDNNIELKELSNRKGIKMISYAQALSLVFNDYKGIAVVGSHGKTTVSAWLTYVLYQAAKDPKALIGARVPQLKGSSLAGKSNYLIAEVDEYQNKLKYFNPFATVLLNIDFDHPDFFKTQLAYTKVFSDFVKKINKQGFLVYNLDDKKCTAASSKVKAKKLSLSLEDSSANFFAYNLKQNKLKQSFDLQINKKGKKRNFKNIDIKLLGKHSIYNALAVIASSLELGLSIKEIKEGLFSFKGTARRMEFLGKYKNMSIYDDYGHHPAEIKTTISGLRAKYKDRRISVVFHPHTYTRTKALFNDFIVSFSEADEVLINDIYGSAREKQGGVSSKDLARAIKEYNKKQGIKQRVKATGGLKATENYLRKTYKDKDIVLLLGAGDIFRVADSLLKD
ncbi:UDP-N-acetylmuramate--L-alanine ligase [Patescibacteria group bacterium]|nr:UDP-N-acetylmuramate--L-alanine ligase [Patescibacteria group bacterium]